MNAVVIQSKNQDFTEVVSALVEKELGVSCHVVRDAVDNTWPEAFVISDENQPVRMRDVLEKVKCFLQNSKADTKIEIGECQLSVRLKLLMYCSKTVDVTDKEIGLLQSLHRAGVAGMERDELLKQVWGFEANINTHTLETHLYRLRAKLRELSGRDDIICVSEGKYRLE